MIPSNHYVIKRWFFTLVFLQVLIASMSLGHMITLYTKPFAFLGISSIELFSEEHFFRICGGGFFIQNFFLFLFPFSLFLVPFFCSFLPCCSITNNPNSQIISRITKPPTPEPQPSYLTKTQSQIVKRFHRTPSYFLSPSSTSPIKKKRKPQMSLKQTLKDYIIQYYINSQEDC